MSRTIGFVGTGLLATALLVAPTIANAAPTSATASAVAKPAVVMPMVSAGTHAGYCTTWYGSAYTSHKVTFNNTYSGSSRVSYAYFRVSSYRSSGGYILRAWYIHAYDTNGHMWTIPTNGAQTTVRGWLTGKVYAQDRLMYGNVDTLVKRSCWN